MCNIFLFSNHPTHICCTHETNNDFNNKLLVFLRKKSYPTQTIYVERIWRLKKFCLNYDEIHAITNFPSHDLIMEIIWKNLFYKFMILHMDIMSIKHVWCMYKWLKIFHLTYTCTTCVLNAQYPCAKTMNPWNNTFHANFKWTNEVSKFAMVGPKGHMMFHDP
jgi:hypothetical protein